MATQQYSIKVNGERAVFTLTPRLHWVDTEQCEGCGEDIASTGTYKASPAPRVVCDDCGCAYSVAKVAS